MKRCGLYTRIEIDGSGALREESLDAQMDRLQEYVESKNTGDEEDWEVAFRYRDASQPGPDTYREEYQWMLHDVESGHVDIVLCTAVARVSRSLTEFGERCKRCEISNWVLLSLK